MMPDDEGGGRRAASLSFACRYRYRDGFQLDAEFQTAKLKTALIGPSGSGKTSVLNLIAGLLKADEAKVRLGDRVFVDTAQGIWLPPERRRVGYVFQEHRLFPHRSVAGNLAYGRRRAADLRVDEQKLLEILQLQPLLPRGVESLSGGQQRRVAIGRALLAGAEILLLDEPLTGQDQALREQILGHLDEIIRQFAIPTILVTHDIAEAERWAEQIVQIEAGRVISGDVASSDAISGETIRPGPRSE